MKKKIVTKRLRLTKETLVNLGQVLGGTRDSNTLIDHTVFDTTPSGQLYTCGGLGCADTQVDCHTIGHDCQNA